MEYWQKQYLTANKYRLVELTDCNETLLSRLSSNFLLSKADLGAIRSTRNPMEQARRLFDILETKVGGFEAMSRALFESQQSGAYDIFHYIECLPRTLHIRFSGEATPLANFLDKAEIEEIIQKHVHVFEYKGSESETVSLLNDAPPPGEPTLYIPRKLFRRNVVNTALFQEKSSDIFVFKGFHDLPKLVQMVKPQIASKSSKQMGNLTCRFILLENDEDWKEICEIAKAPVHLIKYEEETKTCVLEQTKGIPNIIKPYISREKKHQNLDMAISEEAFIHHVVRDSAPGVCICDLPGMGKTLLLAKISNKLTELYPDRVVAFVSLSQFINSVVTSKDITINCSKEEAHKFIAKYLATTPLAQDILEKTLSKQTIRLELLFDAFDEVPFQYLNFAKKLLTAFATRLSNARIYVTSRPHMRQELEEGLGVQSYDIVPFSEANQLEFLVSFWKRETGVDDNEKLEQFARYILEKLKTSLSKTEQDMTGIPLQCRLLAQVYSRNAKLYATRKMLMQECCHFEGSLPLLYREYVQQSFYKKLGSPLENIFSVTVQKYHILMAIKTLFPECKSQLLQELKGDMADFVVNLIFSIGILERRVGRSGQTVEFVHRTFAEYFVSEFMAQLLKESQLTTSLSSKSKGDALKLLLENTLMTREISDTSEIEEQIFINNVVVYFFDFFVDFYRPFKSIQLVVQQFPSSVSPEHLNRVFFGCARENYTKLMKFIHDVLLCMEKLALEQYKKKTLPLGKPQRIIRLLNVASLFSSHSFVDELFTLSLECFKCDLSVVCKKMPLNQDTPLHFAVQRANVELVQFLARHISLEGRKILRSCVIGSSEYPVETVNRQVEICKILLGINGKLRREANYSLYDNVHVELFKFLIGVGADARAAESEENIVHRSAGYMSSSDFHELCRFLIFNVKAQDLFIANEAKWKNPLPYIFRRQGKLSIETCSLILGIDGVDVNERDGHNNNLFLIAVEKKYEVDVLDFLAKAGADIHAINAEGQNALHLAAEAKNAYVLTFLLNLGLHYRLQDSLGNSFLHLLGSKGITTEEYQAIVCELTAKRQTDIFHVRNSAGQLVIHWAVYHLELTKQTLQHFKSNLVDFNEVDNDGFSVVWYAVAGGRSVHFLRMLIDMGVDIMKGNKYGETFAHFIPKYCTAEQYHELMVFLTSEGFGEAFTTKDFERTTPLHWAAFYIELLPETLDLIHRKLVQQNKVDINSKCYEGCSILMYAAAGKRSFRILKTLMEMGADVYVNDISNFRFSNYIHHFYSIQQYHKMVEYLKSRGHRDAVTANPADVFGIESILMRQPEDMTNRDGGLFKRKRVISSNISENGTSYCVLINAVYEKRSVSLLKSSIEKGADIHIHNEKGDNFAHYLPFFYSPEQYHEILEFLIRRGQQKVCAVANNNGITPIHFALVKLELLETTLDLFNSFLFQTKIVGINAIDNQGHSLLMYAATGERSVGLLKTLIEIGSDINIQTEKGLNFAHLIAEYYSAKQYHELVEFLIFRDQQKIFEVANNNGQTPIHLAVSKLKILKSTFNLFYSTLFQTNIIDINSTDKWGNSLLMSAAKGKQSVSLLKKLIENGADVHIQNENGENFAHKIPFFYTPEQYNELVEFLISRGQQKVFAVANIEGQTPIQLAVSKLELLNSTLDLFDSTVFKSNIVDINSTDKWGDSILKCAAQKKWNVRFLKRLIENGADIHFQDKDGYNFAHLIAYYYSAEQYHELVEFLISRGQQRVFSVANNNEQTPILVAVLKLELLESTLDLFDSTIFKTNIIDFNFKDKWGNSVLLCAAEKRWSVSLLKSLIENVADVQIQNRERDNFAHLIPFFYTPEQYHELVVFLINRGEQKLFAVTNYSKQTPIHVAAYKLELLESTLDLFDSTLFQTNIVDINSTDKCGNSILIYAVYGKQSVSLLKNLIENGADVHIQNENGENFAHKIPFFYTPEQYNELVEFLLSRGQQKVFAVANNNRLTPIHVAVFIQKLLESTVDLFGSTLFQTNIVDINSTTKRGDSILMYAVQGKQSVSLLKSLIEKGADINVQNETGHNFAHLISEHYLPAQYHEIVKYLIGRGQQEVFIVANNNGMKPIHFAVLSLELHPKTLKLLSACYVSQNPELLHTSPQQRESISHGLNEVDNNGDSVLHWALRGKRSLQFVKHLISLGADWSVQSNHKSSLAHRSASLGLVEHLKYFVELGCDVNALDNDGDNVLQCAIHDASENVYEMVTFLLANGVDKHHKDKKGHSAYTYALEKGITDKRILEML